MSFQSMTTPERPQPPCELMAVKPREEHRKSSCNRSWKQVPHGAMIAWVLKKKYGFKMFDEQRLKQNILSSVLNLIADGSPFKNACSCPFKTL